MIVSYHNIMNYLGMAFLLVDLGRSRRGPRSHSALYPNAVHGSKSIFILYLQALIRSFRRRPDAHALF